MVATTLKDLTGERRCFRKVGSVLVEKDLATVKKDLDVEIANIKQTLEVVYKSMKQQEEILCAFENKYGDLLKNTKKTTEKKETGQTKASGVLV